MIGQPPSPPLEKETKYEAHPIGASPLGDPLLASLECLGFRGKRRELRIFLQTKAVPTETPGILGFAERVELVLFGG